MKKLILGTTLVALFVVQFASNDLGGTHYWASDMGPTIHSIVAKELDFTKSLAGEDGYYHCGYSGVCSWIPSIENYRAEVML
ncbi:hypothetical protein [Ruegeria arenilitoris]|uniref:hypothetical protein n=1 Tax=Ruegeria arenilitoris TaxID=1173585 RepID=UPI001481BA43|nr:hypothetical protein [Ruegeria arenilitoris]